MKILIDASNIKTGGGVQVALSVIHELEENYTDQFRFHYLVSDAVFQQLSICDLKVTCLTASISSLAPFSKVRRTIEKLALNHDLTFTVFGPPFWYANKKNKHLIGFANAWLLNSDSCAYKKFSVSKRVITKLKNFILLKLLYRQHSYYVTETEVMKNLFLRKFKGYNKDVFVVPNGLSYIYEKGIERYKPVISDKYDEHFKLITITHNYPHKNLNILVEVSKLLVQEGRKFIFFVTFPPDEYNKMSDDFKNYTVNLGVVNITDCPSYYENVDALFLPTLIECFSVSYLEAMYHRLPILTSDLDFARAVCGDAALFFDPFDPVSIKNRIIQVMDSRCLQSELVERGLVTLQKYPMNSDKVSSYIKIISEILGINYV